MNNFDLGALLCRKILEKDYTSLIEKYFNSLDILKTTSRQDKALGRIIDILQSMILSSQIYNLEDVEEYCIYTCGMFMEIQDQERQLSSEEILNIYKSGVELKELLKKSVKNSG